MRIGIVFFYLLTFCQIIKAGENIEQTEIPVSEVNKVVEEYMDKGKIPGISLVLIKGDKYYTNSFGYSDLENEDPVTSKTLFEIGSCSKAFTALAILKLESEQKINLEANIRDYIPWFKAYYLGKEEDIKIKYLLHHTSGIPWYTISLIPRSNDVNALEQTIRKVDEIELHKKPGSQYEYATINYDILAFIIEEITGQSFEFYLGNLLIEDLGLIDTKIGKQLEDKNMSRGYKIGFYRPREYEAPEFKGNNAAGYIVSNIEDITLWLKYQMGYISSNCDTLISNSHLRDETVMPHELSSYAYGWNVSLKGDEEIYHSGLNPNFSSFIGFQKNNNIGVAVLANSNSPFTKVLGNSLLKVLAGEQVSLVIDPDDSNDKAYSTISILFGIYLIFVLAYFFYIVYGIVKGVRKYNLFTLKKLGNVIVVLLFILPFLYGIYILPKALAGFNWDAAVVWTPVSFLFAVKMCFVAIVLSYFAYVFSVLFPERDTYLRDMPRIILMSVLSGLSNMVVILLITSSFKSGIELKYTLYYFCLAMFVYLIGRKTVQTKMIYITRNIIYDMRIKLINKVFSTTYENFEKIERGRVYTTMNDDIGTIGESANMFIRIITSIITAVGAFIYLSTLAFWATMITILLVGTISTIYYIVSRKTHVLFEEARETRTVFMGLLNGMIDGFKELSIHRNKKLEYKKDVEVSTDEYRKKISTAQVSFVNAFLIGESLLILTLAVVAFAIPRLFPGIQFYTVMSFIIILLYLIGPVNTILGAIPQAMQFKIAWNRIKKFIQDIPADLKLEEMSKVNDMREIRVQSLNVQSVAYQYPAVNGNVGFSVGPVNLKLQYGEVLFIIGGNGSGKTTLAKILTGLYKASDGDLFINNVKVDQNEIGEYFSTVFNPLHLFKKLYDVKIDEESRESELKELLKALQLEQKVAINSNEYNTIDLSGGQRKRLGLLQCYLEDKPIYLFDEWAADQDPEYRKFFYRELIPRMKKNGKIIIAITHDDHYFDVADQVLKLNMGKVEYYKSSKEVEKGIFTKA